MIQENVVKVGMADLNVNKGHGIIKTTGLGSCVGLTLFDSMTKVAGMAHIMLPTSSIVKDGPVNVAKYADTAVPELIRKMEQLGGNRGRFVAKMAGGAQMFAIGTTMETMRVGARNVEATKEKLQFYGIPLLAEDTGMSHGRTIELMVDTGILVVRSVQFGVREL